MKEDIKEQQEIKKQQELSNDELLNVTGGVADPSTSSASSCQNKGEAACKQMAECKWVNKIGYIMEYCTTK